MVAKMSWSYVSDRCLLNVGDYGVSLDSLTKGMATEISLEDIKVYA